MTNSNQKNSYAIPAAIVIAGIFISASVYLSGGGTQSALIDNDQSAEIIASLDNVAPVSESDNIMGDRNAPIIIVEYSDFECPFCKRFHDTMNKVMDKYSESGEVAWVFRQFPLPSHPKNAMRTAVASECVAELGGSDDFWTFTDEYFAGSPSNDQTDFDTLVPGIIADLGISSDKFNECLVSGKYDDKIASDLANAGATGGKGTPWSILIGPDGQKFSINGAQSQSTVEQLIESILNN